MKETKFAVNNVLLDITEDERRMLVTQKMNRIINRLVKDSIKNDVKAIKS